MTKKQKINNDYLIYEAYNTIDDSFGLMVAFREYLKTDNFQPYQADKMLNCLFTVLFDAQKNLSEFIEAKEGATND